MGWQPGKGLAPFALLRIRQPLGRAEHDGHDSIHELKVCKQSIHSMNRIWGTVIDHSKEKE